MSLQPKKVFFFIQTQGTTITQVSEFMSNLHDMRREARGASPREYNELINYVPGVFSDPSYKPKYFYGNILANRGEDLFPAIISQTVEKNFGAILTNRN